MPYIDWKKLKGRVALAEILAHYGLLGDLAESAHGFEGVCPLCGSKAFKVNVEKNAWFCFGTCRAQAKTNGEPAGGNILDFVARKERISVKEAAARIAAWFPEERGASEDKKKQEDTGQARQEPAGARGGEGNSKPLPTPQESPTVVPGGPVWVDGENKPLPFALKGIDAGHEEVAALGVTTAIAARYGAGYFTGKGSMAGRVVFPFHDDGGRIVGYAGYGAHDRSWKYPAADKFNPARAVFGMYEAKADGAAQDTLAVCRTPLAALQYRSAQQGVLPIAITTDTLSRYQEDVIADLMVEREQLLVIAARDDPHAIDILGRLIERYFVKFVRT